MHERIKNKIQQQIEKYIKHNNKGKINVIFRRKIGFGFTLENVPTSPRTLLTTSNGGPCKMGPTNDLSHYLASDMRQGADEWSDVDHQDVAVCPRQ